MNLPIEAVVDAIMANADHCESGGLYVYVKDAVDGSLVAESMDELAAKVREYLLTLVPKPVLLSECEEFKTVDVFRSIKAHRERGDAFSADDRWIGNASDFQVIQPVEVPHEADRGD